MYLYIDLCIHVFHISIEICRDYIYETLYIETCLYIYVRMYFGYSPMLYVSLHESIYTCISHFDRDGE